MDSLRRTLKRLIPTAVFSLLQPPYHFSLAFLSALWYGFPTRKLFVIGVTGTKGKTTTTELLNAILEHAGYQTALAGTLRFKIGSQSKPNRLKMTMPGRFELQKFFRQAVDAGCTHALVEITSEGVIQFRHRFIYLDALIFTNLAPEHIESHGSYENYINAKLEIGKQLLRSGKPQPLFVGNKDDRETQKFINLGMKNVKLFSHTNSEAVTLSKTGSSFLWRTTHIETRLPGAFNIDNSLAALTCAEALGVSAELGAEALKQFTGILGRMQEIPNTRGFTIIVDYAHTPESLEAVYKTYETDRKICVLSGTGGGRDKWKRPKMGAIASRYCDEIILTNEDPYDEDPRAIIEDIKKGIDNPRTEIEIDRRIAIGKALKKAKRGDVVLVTGKGTDPFIMGPRGSKELWSDAAVVAEELQKLNPPA